jgi:hypothetical protein
MELKYASVGVVSFSLGKSESAVIGSTYSSPFSRAVHFSHASPLGFARGACPDDGFRCEFINGMKEAVIRSVSDDAVLRLLLPSSSASTAISERSDTAYRRHDMQVHAHRSRFRLLKCVIEVDYKQQTTNSLSYSSLQA